MLIILYDVFQLEGFCYKIYVFAVKTMIPAEINSKVS